jgi:hypothetical protein
VLKYLRIAVSALSLTVCVLLIALWVRSYWTLDLVSRVSSSGQTSTFGSNDGAVYFVERPSRPMRAFAGSRVSLPRGFFVRRPRPHGWRHSSGKVNELARPERFQWEIKGGTAKIKFPHWLLVLTMALVAAIPWIRRRFSLRTLLIATTLVSVGLGVIVFSR